MLILTDAGVRLRSKGINGMLHRGHIIFGDSIRYVADEKVLDRIPIREEGSLLFRVIAHRKRTIVLSPMFVKLRAFTHKNASIVLSPIECRFRAFTHEPLTSCFYP